MILVIRSTKPSHAVYSLALGSMTHNQMCPLCNAHCLIRLNAFLAHELILAVWSLGVVVHASNKAKHA